MRSQLSLFPCRYRPRGFTLIEMMITVALIAILLATALPSYRGHVRKSLRTEAQAYLMSVAGRQQQFLVDTRAYAATLDATGLVAPARVAGAYTLTLEVAAGPPQTFLLTATPKTDQSVEPCGVLTLNQAGAKTAAKAGCW
jgi:type IV pilus assembly protein PilE